MRDQVQVHQSNGNGEQLGFLVEHLFSINEISAGLICLPLVVLSMVAYLFNFLARLIMVSSLMNFFVS